MIHAYAGIPVPPLCLLPWPPLCLPSHKGPCLCLCLCLAMRRVHVQAVPGQELPLVQRAHGHVRAAKLWRLPALPILRPGRSRVRGVLPRPAECHAGHAAARVCGDATSACAHPTMRVLRRVETGHCVSGHKLRNSALSLVYAHRSVYACKRVLYCAPRARAARRAVRASPYSTRDARCM